MPDDEKQMFVCFFRKTKKKLKQKEWRYKRYRFILNTAARTINTERGRFVFQFDLAIKPILIDCVLNRLANELMNLCIDLNWHPSNERKQDCWVKKKGLPCVSKPALLQSVMYFSWFTHPVDSPTEEKNKCAFIGGFTAEFMPFNDKRHVGFDLEVQSR